KIDRDVQLSFVAPDFTHENVARFSSAEHEGARYLMLRFRPDLSAVANLKSPSKQHRDWVFLFESSADRNPLLARVQIDVIRTLLANAEHDDTFNIVTAGTDSQTFSREAQKATPQNIAAVIAFLERTHLIGALDLKQAIEATLPLLKAGTHP